jgi:hypothetical protein
MNILSQTVTTPILFIMRALIFRATQVLGLYVKHEKKCACYARKLVYTVSATRGDSQNVNSRSRSLNSSLESKVTPSMNSHYSEYENESCLKSGLNKLSLEMKVRS